MVECTVSSIYDKSVSIVLLICRDAIYRVRLQRCRHYEDAIYRVRLQRCRHYEDAIYRVPTLYTRGLWSTTRFAFNSKRGSVPDATGSMGTRRFRATRISS